MKLIKARKIVSYFEKNKHDTVIISRVIISRYSSAQIDMAYKQIRKLLKRKRKNNFRHHKPETIICLKKDWRI